MRKTRRLKKAASVAAVVAMTATMMPFGVVADSLGVMPVVAYAAEQTGESQSKVLTTIWNNVEVGTHEGNGSAVYSADTKSITVTGAGTMFGKDSGKDDCFYSYVNVKGNTTVVAKITPDSANASGVVGIMAKNDASEDTSMAAGVYYDYDKKQIRAGRHGGAANLSSDVTTPVYVKLEFSEGACYYTVAKDADFTDIIAERKGMGVDGLDPKTVGLFATSGNKADFSDVKITSKYTQDDNTINKVVFDSNIGELSMERLSSKDTSGSYGNFTYSESADGNVLTLKSSRDSSDKAEIRNDKSTNYLLFPETTEDMTISADITIKYLNNGTDKQGIAVGQFAVTAGKKVQMDIFQFNKNLAAQHNFTTTDGSTNGGNPKLSDLIIPTAVGGNYATYTVTYSKKGDAAYVTMKSADGKDLLSGDTGKIDLTASAASLGSGKSVRYGLAIGGATADVSNITLYNADGEVVYDMNDYYVATGVAPVITNASSVIASDRMSIDLAWDVATEGTGNVKYSVYVSKDGADYVKAGDSKVNSFSYTAMDGDGSYKFKIVPVGGETSGTAIETEAVNYKTPLKQAVLKAEATDKNISLTWDAVDEATSYDIYKALGSDVKPELVKTTTDTAFNDTDVTAEEPYYYYVIAKNDNNTSNPSITLQVLASNGHTGTYVYENEAAKITVTSKDNDTVMTNKASVSMKSDKAGTAKLVVNGKEVTSKAVKADEEFSFEASLVQGRNDVDVLLTDEAGKTTRKVFNFVSNPKYDIVVDSAFAGTDGDAVDGYATYKTVQAAVNSVSADNAESKVIFIKNGEYNERVTVEVPNVSLLGEDAEKTHIYYSAALADKTAVDMWTRNAMYVGSDADGFTAENLTVENSFAYTNGSDQQADALCIVADKTACVNVRLVGYQDTLLTDSRVKGADGNYEVTRQYFSKCYITGNVDFIYGAGTSYFDDCDIVARYTEYKADGCFTAGRTYASTDYGYVFNNCRFTAEDKVADDSYRMARPWGKDDSTTFINCYLGRAIADTGYGDMSGNSYKNARFAEYGSYGPGYVLNNDRPLLSSSQAAGFTINKVLGDYDAVSVVKALYAKDAVEEPLEISVDSNVSGTMVVGSTLKLTANATGGSGDYTYKFIVYNKDTGKWGLVQNFSSKNECSWVAGDAGNREFYVDVKDAAGNVVRSKVINVKSSDAVSVTASSSVVQPGAKITFKASTALGDGCTYKFIIYNPTTDKWFKLQDFSSSSEYTWTAGDLGKRQIYVDVKDASGKVTRSKVVNVNVANAFSVTTNVSAPTNKTGDKVTFTAEASGGQADYTYKMVVYNKTTKKWGLVQGFSKNNSITWVAGDAGEREFYIDVKDASGKVVRSKVMTVITSK